jgi:hypothetical protein
MHLLGEKREGAGSATKKMTSPLEMKIYNDYLSIKNRNEKIKIYYNNEIGRAHV